MDEDCTRQVAHYDLAGIMENSLEDIHPPLYSCIMHIWVSIFGESEASLRFPSVIFGVFAIWWIYLLGRILFNESAGLLAAAIMALNTFHVAYSQEARSYSLMAFLSLVSMYFFVKILREEKNTMQSRAAYTVFSAFLLYTHTYAVFTVIVQNVFLFSALLLRKHFAWKQIKSWIVLQATLFFLYLPWILISKKDAGMINHNFWIETPTLKLVWVTFRSYAGFMLLKLYALLMAFSVYKAFRSGKSDYFFSFALLSLWTLVTMGLPIVVSLIWMPIFSPRYTIAATFPFYLLAAKGICDIGQRHVRWVLALVVLACSVYGLTIYFSHPQKTQFREAAHFVEEHSKPGDLIVFHRDFTLLFEYYSKKEGLIKKTFPKGQMLTRFVPVEDSLNVTPDKMSELESLVKGHDRVWVILSHSKDRSGLIDKTLLARYRRIYDEKYLNVEVLFFTK